MLKASIATTTLLCALSAHAQSENQCLSAGEIAEMSAVLMESGQSEEYVVGILTDPKGKNPKIPKVRQKIITETQVGIVTYVFTMRPSPSEARSTVYLKCMAGGLGYTDWSKYPAAARAR